MKWRWMLVGRSPPFLPVEVSAQRDNTAFMVYADINEKVRVQGLN